MRCVSAFCVAHRFLNSNRSPARGRQGLYLDHPHGFEGRRLRPQIPNDLSLHHLHTIPNPPRPGTILTYGQQDAWMGEVAFVRNAKILKKRLSGGGKNAQVPDGGYVVQVPGDVVLLQSRNCSDRPVAIIRDNGSYSFGTRDSISGPGGTGWSGSGGEGLCYDASSGEIGTSSIDVRKYQEWHAGAAAKAVLARRDLCQKYGVNFDPQQEDWRKEMPRASHAVVKPRIKNRGPIRDALKKLYDQRSKTKTDPAQVPAAVYEAWPRTWGTPFPGTPNYLDSCDPKEFVRRGRAQIREGEPYIPGAKGLSAISLNDLSAIFIEGHRDPFWSCECQLADTLNGVRDAGKSFHDKMRAEVEEILRSGAVGYQGRVKFHARTNMPLDRAALLDPLFFDPTFDDRRAIQELQKELDLTYAQARRSLVFPDRELLFDFVARTGPAYSVAGFDQYRQKGFKSSIVSGHYVSPSEMSCDLHSISPNNNPAGYGPVGTVEGWFYGQPSDQEAHQTWVGGSSIRSKSSQGAVAVAGWVKAFPDQKSDHRSVYGGNPNYRCDHPWTLQIGPDVNPIMTDNVGTYVPTPPPDGADGQTWVEHLGELLNEQPDRNDTKAVMIETACHPRPTIISQILSNPDLFRKALAQGKEKVQRFLIEEIKKLDPKLPDFCLDALLDQDTPLGCWKFDRADLPGGGRSGNLHENKCVVFPSNARKQSPNMKVGTLFLAIVAVCLYRIAFSFHCCDHKHNRTCLFVQKNDFVPTVLRWCDHVDGREVMGASYGISCVRFRVHGCGCF